MDGTTKIALLTEKQLSIGFHKTFPNILQISIDIPKNNHNISTAALPCLEIPYNTSRKSFESGPEPRHCPQTSQVQLQIRVDMIHSLFEHVK